MFFLSEEGSDLPQVLTPPREFRSVDVRSFVFAELSFHPIRNSLQKIVTDLQVVLDSYHKPLYPFPFLSFYPVHDISFLLSDHCEFPPLRFFSPLFLHQLMVCVQGP